MEGFLFRVTYGWECSRFIDFATLFFLEVSFVKRVCKTWSHANLPEVAQKWVDKVAVSCERLS